MSDQPVSKKKKRGAPLGNTNAMLHGKSNVTFQDLLTKRGAPFGNSNAMTHGFYSSRLSSKHVAGFKMKLNLCESSLVWSQNMAPAFLTLILPGQFCSPSHTPPLPSTVLYAPRLSFPTRNSTPTFCWKKPLNT